MLQKCQAGVRARDQALRVAHVGVVSWYRHVKAQTDANAGRISVARMNAIFTQTRLAGGGEVLRYQRAVAAANRASATCQAPAGASAAVKGTLQKCAARSRAQQPFLNAAADAMVDWNRHLAAMRRSRMGHVHNAQEVWIQTWRAAPPHLRAYIAERHKFDPPAC